MPELVEHPYRSHAAPRNVQPQRAPEGPTANGVAAALVGLIAMAAMVAWWSHWAQTQFLIPIGS
jgi:hypothetical protein